MVQIPVLASVNKLHGRCQLRIAFIGGEELRVRRSHFNKDLWNKRNILESH